MTARLALPAAITLSLSAPLFAIEIDGVGNGSLDQPRVNMVLRPQPVAGETSTQDPLAGDLGGLQDLLEELGLPGGMLSPYNIQAFYDTGAGVGLIGGYTAQSYGLPIQGEEAVFTDVGVGGAETFRISDRLTVQVASTAPNLDVSDLDNFRHVFPDVYAASGDTPEQTDALDPVDQALSDLLGSLYDFNVLGMPYFKDKVVVMDARSLNAFAGGEGELSLNNPPQLFTHVYDRNDPDLPAWDPSNIENPGVPTPGQVHLTLELDYAEFSGLTTTEGGTPPTLAHNPMIGGGLPDHLNETVDDRDDNPGVTITRGSASSTGAWLFDTGAAATIISAEQAEALGVRYREGAGPGPTGTPILEDAATGEAIGDQFTLQLGGVGGTLTAAGFFLDALTLPGIEDYFGGQVPEDLTFLNAPVLVLDIAIDDPNSPDGRFVLDGIFGMNFLVASTFIDGGIDPTGGALDLVTIPGAFDFIVFDEANNLVHLAFNEALIPEPAALAMMGMGTLTLLRRRRVTR